MLRKRKFRELKTADAEKALWEKSVPKSTRLNNQAANEESGFDVERDKIQSIDANSVNVTAELLNLLADSIC